MRVDVECIPVLGDRGEQCRRRCPGLSEPLRLDQSTQSLDFELYRRGIEHTPEPAAGHSAKADILSDPSAAGSWQAHGCIQMSGCPHLPL